MLEHFAQYGHALAALVIYAVIINVLNAAVGISKGGQGFQPGAEPEADYGSRLWRIERTYMNAVEMFGFYAAITFAAILAGASPFWINLLASFGLLTRLGVCFVYLRGIGKAYGGLRTNLNILASLANFAMAALALLAVFGGAK